MTGNMVDYFSLDSRKKKEITIDMLEYDYVNKCTDIDELKGILSVLLSGKEGKYPALEKYVEEKLLSVLPENLRRRIESMQKGPTNQDIENESNSLYEWMDTMKQKQTLSEKPSHINSIPPPRFHKTQILGENSIETSSLDIRKTKKESAAIPGFDFAAWSQYDVDKALDEIDEKDKEKEVEILERRKSQEERLKQRRQEFSSLPSYVNVDALTDKEREFFALREKQKGNECVKSSEWEDAIIYYTRSIAYDDSNAIVHANRALAYLKLSHFQKAESDCSRAITLDESYTKAWYRRGMIRYRRGIYAGAVGDFEKALSQSPNKREIQKLLEKTKSKWKEVEGEQFNKIKGNSKPNPGLEKNQMNQNVDRTRISNAERCLSEDSNNLAEVLAESDDDDDDEICTQTLKGFKRFEIIEE